MSSVILKDYTANIEYDVVLTDSLNPVIAASGDTVTLPVSGRATIIKGDAGASMVTILPTSGWTYADGDYAKHLSVMNESATFQCDTSTSKYYEV